MRQAGQGGHNTLNSSPQGSPLPLLYLDVYCRDALVKAPTGSGKTLAYLVPIIQVRGLPPMAGLRSRLDPFLPVFSTLPYPCISCPPPAPSPLLQDLQGQSPKISRSEGTHAIIIVPTRELCIQIQDVAVGGGGGWEGQKGV